MIRNQFSVISESENRKNGKKQDTDPKIKHIADRLLCAMCDGCSFDDIGSRIKITMQ
jgi:hypothetical protein